MHRSLGPPRRIREVLRERLALGPLVKTLWAMEEKLRMIRRSNTQSPRACVRAFMLTVAAATIP